MLALTWGLRYFRKRGDIKKGCTEIEDWGFSVHFMFQLRYYKLVQSLYKNWLLVSKITQGIWTISYKQWKVQNVEIWWVTFVQKIHLSKKYISWAKRWYAEDLSNITFNYSCKNSPNYLCPFWNQKGFFTTQLLCIFSAQTLHSFYKISASECKFSDFPLLGLKFTKFLMSFSNKKSVFLESLDLFSVSSEIILLYFFSWNFICYWQK